MAQVVLSLEEHTALLEKIKFLEDNQKKVLLKKTIDLLKKKTSGEIIVKTTKSLSYINLEDAVEIAKTELKENIATTEKNIAEIKKVNEYLSKENARLNTELSRNDLLKLAKNGTEMMYKYNRLVDRLQERVKFVPKAFRLHRNTDILLLHIEELKRVQIEA